MKNLKEILDHYTSDLKFDKKFMEVLNKWKNEYYSRNPEHVAFFTGAYFGLHIPKWTGHDNDYWFIDLIEQDEDEIGDHITALPTINKDWSVSSNTLSILLLYFCHRAHTSKYLNPKERDQFKIIVMEIMVARYITSQMNYYFSRGPTTVEIAKETHSRLSKKFIIKSEGSWMKFIHNRAETYTVGEYVRDAKYSKQEVFETFQDELVVRKLNEIKSSINDAIQEINVVFREVLEDDMKVATTSAMANGSEGLYLKDLVSNKSEYLRYQDTIFTDRNTFIKTDLMEVIESSMPTISVAIFRETMDWIYQNQNDRKWKDKILQLRHDILTYSLAMLQEENIKQNDLLHVAYRIRQNFTSGRASDPTLNKCRKLADTFIVTYRPKSKGKLITLERTAIMMYFVLRTLAKQFYN